MKPFIHGICLILLSIFALFALPAHAGSHPCGSHLTNCVYDCCCFMDLPDCEDTTTAGECCDMTYRCYKVIDYCPDTTTTTTTKPTTTTSTSTTTTTKPTTTTTTTSTTTLPLTCNKYSVSFNGVSNIAQGRYKWQYTVCQDTSQFSISHWVLQSSICDGYTVEGCMNDAVGCDGQHVLYGYGSSLGNIQLVYGDDPTTGLHGFKFEGWSGSFPQGCQSFWIITGPYSQKSLGAVIKTGGPSPPDCPFKVTAPYECTTTSSTTTSSTTTSTSTTTTSTTTSTIPTCASCSDGTSCGEENALGQDCVCSKTCDGSLDDCPFVCELSDIPTCTKCPDGTPCGKKNSAGRECICSKSCDGSDADCPFKCELGSTTTSTSSTTSSTTPTCASCPDGTACGSKNPSGRQCICALTCSGNPPVCEYNCVLSSSTTSSTITTTTIPTCAACPDGTLCGKKNSAGRECVCGKVCVNQWSCTYMCVLDRLPTTTFVSSSTTSTTQKRYSDDDSSCCGTVLEPNVAKEIGNLYCNNGVKDAGESDVDCGGPCGPCADGKACISNRDCRVADCTDGLCRAVHCSDGVKNSGESDVDCGGACGLCADGMKCWSKNDCRSGDCTGGVCRHTHCSNGKTDADETDVDCGGSCPKCPGIGKCVWDTDCVSGKCTDGRCGVLAESVSQTPKEMPHVSPLCRNGRFDAGEADVDCGGVCGQCADKKKCFKDSDCESNYCLSGVCTPAKCGNRREDAGEEGVDCGGPCPECRKTEEERGMSIVYGFLTFLIVVLMVFLLVYSGRKGEEEAVSDYAELERAHRHRLHKS